jgi:hypothetical protein
MNWQARSQPGPGDRLRPGLRARPFPVVAGSAPKKHLAPEYCGLEQRRHVSHEPPSLRDASSVSACNRMGRDQPSLTAHRRSLSRYLPSRRLCLVRSNSARRQNRENDTALLHPTGRNPRGHEWNDDRGNDWSIVDGFTLIPMDLTTQHHRRRLGIVGNRVCIATQSVYNGFSRRGDIEDA